MDKEQPLRSSEFSKEDRRLLNSRGSTHNSKSTDLEDLASTKKPKVDSGMDAEANCISL